MKKKVIGFGTLFLLALSLFIGTVIYTESKFESGDSAPSFSINTENPDEKYDALITSGEVHIHVGEVFDF